MNELQEKARDRCTSDQGVDKKEDI